MRHTTLLLALAALAATSRSLQLDSQYGLRWDRRIPTNRNDDFKIPNSQVKTVQTHKCTLIEAFGYNRILLFFFALETHIKLTINILFKIPV